MCLAIPLKIVEIAPDRSSGTVEISGTTLQVGLDLVPETKVGDYVLVHTGMAIELLDYEDAQEILEIYENFIFTEDKLAPGEKKTDAG